MSTKRIAAQHSVREMVQLLGGSQSLAAELGISEQAIRRWYQKCPADRLAYLQERVTLRVVEPAQPVAQPVAESPEEVAVAVPESPVAPVAPRPQSIELVIARKDEQLAKAALDDAERKARGLPATMPVRWYGLRLVLLAALDAPVIGSAFSYASAVSGATAYASALGMTILMIVAAHEAGRSLRHYGDRRPGAANAVRVIATLMIIAGFLGLGMALRAIGVEASVGEISTSMFSLDAVVAIEPSSASPWLTPILVGIAGLYTLASVLVAMSWSYSRAGPQATLARATVAWRRAARRRARMEKL